MRSGGRTGSGPVEGVGRFVTARRGGFGVRRAVGVVVGAGLVGAGLVGGPALGVGIRAGPAAGGTSAAFVLAFGVAGATAGWGARLLLGRLRRGARVRAPWCELAVAGLWAGTAAAWVAGLVPLAWLPVLLALGWLTVAAGAVDLRHRRLPDVLTVPALPVALLLLFPVGPAAVARGAGGAAIAVAVHAAVHLVDRRAVGAGDVKLAAPLGAVLAAAAWPALALAAVLAAGLTALVGLATGVVRARRGAAPGDRPAPIPRSGGALPHGPSMLAATWLVATLLAGPGGAAGGGGG